MTMERDLTRAGQTALRAAVLEWLGLEERHVRGDLRTVHHGEPYPVVIEWRGAATMTVDQWEQLVAAVVAGDESPEVEGPGPGEDPSTVEGLAVLVAGLAAQVNNNRERIAVLEEGGS